MAVIHSTTQRPTSRLYLIMCSYVEGPRQPVYRVVFYQDLWEGYNGTDDDNLEIEVCTWVVT